MPLKHKTLREASSILDFLYCVICGLTMDEPDALDSFSPAFRASRSKGWISNFTYFTDSSLLCLVYHGPNGVELTGQNIYWKTIVGDPPWQWDHSSDGSDNSTFILYPPDWLEDFYLFHGECWDRLIEHFDGCMPDLGHLYEALELIPIPQRTCTDHPSFSRLLWNLANLFHQI